MSAGKLPSSMYAAIRSILHLAVTGVRRLDEQDAMDDDENGINGEVARKAPLVPSSEAVSSACNLPLLQLLLSMIRRGLLTDVGMVYGVDWNRDYEPSVVVEGSAVVWFGVVVGRPTEVGGFGR